MFRRHRFRYKNSAFFPYSLVYILSLLLLMVDSYGSNETVAKYLNVSSRNIAIYSIVLLLVIRFAFNQGLTKFFSRVNAFLIFPFSLLTCIALTVYDYTTPPNAAFAFVKIQYIQLCIVSIFSLAVIILQFSNEWFRKNFSYLIFAGCFVIFGYAYLSTFFPEDIFYNISKEDFLIEWLQFYVLLVASFFAFLISRHLHVKRKIHSVVFILVALALFIIAGDEISWGQRIFHFTTPEIIAKNNDQKEITIHNLWILAGFVNISYIIIGFYGAFAWIAQVFIPKLRKAPLFFYIPAWYCMGYYFFGFLYNYYDRTTMFHPYSVWSEFAELMLYLGIMFSLLGLMIVLNKNLKE